MISLTGIITFYGGLKMKLFNRLLFSLLFLFIFTSPLFAKMLAGELIILKPYSFESLPGIKNGAVYMEVKNKGKTPVTITKLSSPVAKRVEIHSHEMKNGIMKMIYHPALTIKGGKSVIFKPMDYHIMLLGLKRKLHNGDTFPLTIVVQDGSSVTVQVKVIKRVKSAN